MNPAREAHERILHRRSAERLRAFHDRLCSWCGKEFNQLDSRLTRYCGRACKRLAGLVNNTAEDHRIQHPTGPVLTTDERGRLARLRELGEFTLGEAVLCLKARNAQLAKRWLESFRDMGLADVVGKRLQNRKQVNVWRVR